MAEDCIGIVVQQRDRLRAENSVVPIGDRGSILVPADLIAGRDHLRASLDGTKQEIEPLRAQVALLTKGLDAANLQVERLTNEPHELHKMMIEADHMLGAYSTMRIALKELLRKYAIATHEAADAKLQVDDLKKVLTEIAALLGPPCEKNACEGCGFEINEARELALKAVGL